MYFSLFAYFLCDDSFPAILPDHESNPSVETPDWGIKAIRAHNVLIISKRIAILL